LVLGVAVYGGRVMEYDLSYQRVTGPSGGAQPGTLALRDCVMRKWPQVTSMGIYHPRPIRGYENSVPIRWSSHAGGRAWDCGTTPDKPFGTEISAWLIEHAAALGIQYFIWNRRSWRPDRGWRDYSGQEPHTDHLHIEQTIEAGKTLKLGAIMELEDVPGPYGKLNKPIVAAAVTPSGKGMWLVASDGGVFTEGDAVYYGSTGAMALNKPIIGIVPTSSGDGYTLIASDGGVFTFNALYPGAHTEFMARRDKDPIVAAVVMNGQLVLVDDDGTRFTVGQAS
jgi:hypothetical protein